MGGGEERFVFPFEKLEVYRLAIDLADAIFELWIGCRRTSIFE